MESEGPLKWGFYMGFTESYTGSQRAVISLLSQLNRNLIDPVLITQRESPMVDDARSLGFCVEICPLPESLECRNEAALQESVLKKFQNANRIRAYNRTIAELLRRRGCQGLWVRSIRGVLLTGRATHSVGIPMIWDIGLEKEVRGLLKTILFTRALLLADRVVTQAASVRTQVFPRWHRKLFANKFRVIKTGIRTARIKQLESAAKKVERVEGKFVILVPATINDRKNQMMMLRALRRLRDELPQLVVHFAGPATDGPYFQELVAYVAANRMDSAVQFMGWRDDVPELMAESDLMILCSRNEGVPQSILEAMHAGLPVIGTRAGGIPDVIESESNGWLVAVDDDEALAEQIRRCVGDPQRLADIASQARQFVIEHHSVDKWCRNYEQLIMELAKASRG